ncbi:hypothetical protein GCM10007906_26100 [Vibrio hyugaensis]|uniref:Uncharacterized protein n=2 Tax=Vibrio hyugaensis TaxID=1534743 RepID=A0ABQ5Y362_9VIBR|nr:hypothetical protein GCM10007906_26100 [Vibrio hyugaensis]
MPINEYKSPACPSLESKFGVDLNRFKSDDDYRAYIKLLAHEPIRKHVNNSLVSARLMLEELESSGNELVVDEMLKLKRLGPNISIDAIGSSMSRIKGAGLCL